GPAEYEPGSYVPVSLHWQTQVPLGPAPDWQADPQQGIIFRNGNGEVEVRVANRGTLVANGVSVSLWFAPWADGASPPPWLKAHWTACAATSPATRNIPPLSLGAAAFTFAFTPAPGRYLLFAQATCAADRANTDPALSLPDASLSAPLPDLVANDNNLGLRVVTV
ncbi:MAG: hypothetical protein JWP22_3002, partial [Ramlibacter sp.]|nr:hypothetical protein [Ramlibacter sp.]